MAKHYVRHSNGQYYVQVTQGDGAFSLEDDDQSYPGGFNLGNGSWEIVSEEDVPQWRRKQLEHLFDDE